MPPPCSAAAPCGRVRSQTTSGTKVLRHPAQRSGPAALSAAADVAHCRADEGGAMSSDARSPAAGHAPWPAPPDAGAEASERLAWYAAVARWAPSNHNTQPWRFVVRDGTAVEVWADPMRM